MAYTGDTGAGDTGAVDTGDIKLDSNGTPVPTLFSFIQSSVTEEVKEAKRYTEKVQGTERPKRWDRYYGRPLGNEKKGRSRFISRDVMETIEWIMPSLLSTFVSEDGKIEITIEGQPAIVGRALVKMIQDDMNDDDERSMYVVFYQWFKDALVSDTAFVGPSWLEETDTQHIRIPLASQQHMQVIDQSPDLTLLEYTDNGDGTYSDVDLRSDRITKTKVDVNNLPHWDVIITSEARYINDEYGKGYRSRVSLDYLNRINEQHKEVSGEDFFEGLDRLHTHLSNLADRSSEEGRYMENEGDEYDPSTYPSTSSTNYNEPGYVDPKTMVEVVQWYTRLDVNGDGILENVLCWVAESEVLIRWEENPDDMVMMSALSPIIDCYKFFGISYSELIMDLQNLKTMLVRRILDNFDFSTLGRTFVRPGGKVPIRELLQNIPGDTLLIDPDKVHTEYPQPFDSRVLALLEYVDGQKENRTGSTRYNQGTDADALNKTAAGMSMIQTASQKRIDMIARLFAETGVRDLYKKCVVLYRNNLTSPVTVRVEGQDVQITADMLKGRIKCRANLGVEAQIGMMESQKIQQIFVFLSSINQVFPGIIGPEQVHTLATKFVANMGNKEPESYVQILAKFMESLTATQQQAQKAQQMQIEMEKMDKQIKWAQVQIMAKKNQVDLTEIMEDTRTRVITKQMDVDQKDRGNRLRFIADMAKVQAQKQQRIQASRTPSR